MKRLLIAAIVWALAMVLLTACSAGAGSSTDASGIILPAPADSPAGVPARPDSGVSGDASVNLEDRQEVMGVVKEVNGDLVLISLTQDGGDYMLRFTEDTRWAEGVETELCVGNTVTCVVLPEETFAPPVQGEVIEVLSNEKAG